jgi:hypothetical protein
VEDCVTALVIRVCMGNDAGPGRLAGEKVCGYA